MGEIINLRRARKARERLGRAEEAARNRAAFGRSAPERAAADDDRARRETALDRHRLHAVRDDEPLG